MESKRDLGFFNGVKAEIIPLIAGLVSFTLLAEDAVNQIEKIFHAEGEIGVIVFISIYFVIPVLFIVCWLGIHELP